MSEEEIFIYKSDASGTIQATTESITLSTTPTNI